jgi:A/G-specific adenine glycosylase
MTMETVGNRNPQRAGRALVRWFRRHRRPLPWRGARDPYRIWVSETVLQQTRVEQAVPVYERFIARFPDLGALARASEEEVLKAWEGAGYYARARRLRRAAVELARGGTPPWPTSAEAWERLPGVGPYIARALASLAFGAPVVALEANGRRVAARWFLETGDPAGPAVARRLERHLLDAMPPDTPGEFNEALMELGETVCLPRNPRCPSCPIAGACRALRELPDPAYLPRRRPRSARPHVVAALALAVRGDRFLVRRRPSEGLLGGLWELPGGKLRSSERPIEAAVRELREETGLALVRPTLLGVVRHAYSHFTVELHLVRGRALGRPFAPDGAPLRWVTGPEFDALPRPLATVRAVALARRAGAGGACRGSGARPGRTRPSPRRGARAPAARARSRAPRA